MGWALSAGVNISWVPDGAGAMSVPSAETLQFNQAATLIALTTTGTISAANIATAVTALGTAINSNFGTLNLGTIQGWATGNP
jgi:hypothetical protein